jgi:hypothetical protein
VCRDQTPHTRGEIAHVGLILFQLPAGPPAHPAILEAHLHLVAMHRQHLSPDEGICGVVGDAIPGAHGAQPISTPAPSMRANILGCCCRARASNSGPVIAWSTTNALQQLPRGSSVRSQQEITVISPACQ